MEANSTARNVDPAGANARAHPFPQNVRLAKGGTLFLSQSQVTYENLQPKAGSSMASQQHPPSESIFSQGQHYFSGYNDPRAQPPQGSGFQGQQTPSASDLAVQMEKMGFANQDPSNGQPLAKGINNPQQEETSKSCFESIRGKDIPSSSPEYSTPIKDHLSNATGFDKFRTQQQIQRNTLAGAPDLATNSGLSSNGMSKIPQNSQPQANTRKMSDYHSGQQANTLYSDQQGINLLSSVQDVTSDSAILPEHPENRAAVLFEHSSDASSIYPKEEAERRNSMDLDNLRPQNISLHGRGSSSLGRVQNEVKKAPYPNMGAAMLNQPNRAKPNVPLYTYQQPYQQQQQYPHPHQMGAGMGHPAYFMGYQQQQDNDFAQDLQQIDQVNNRLEAQTRYPAFAQQQHPQAFYTQLPPQQLIYVPIPVHPPASGRKVSSEYGFPNPGYQEQYFMQPPVSNEKNRSFHGKQRPPNLIGSIGSNKSGNSQTMTTSTQLSYQNFLQKIQQEMKEAGGNPEQQVRVLQNNVHRLAKREVGSRFLQGLLPNSTPDILNLLVLEVQDDLVNLINDQFGNYFISDLVKYMTPPQRLKVLDQIEAEDFLQIAFNKQGAYTLQNLLKTLEEDKEFKQIQSKLDQTNGVLRLARDKIGQNVLQMIITTFIDRNRPEFKGVFSCILQQFYHIATDQYGTCILKKTLSHIRSLEQQQLLVKKVSERAREYAQNDFGNFIVSEIVNRLPFEQTKEIYYQIKGHVVLLSKGKASSQVMEKLLYNAPLDFQKVLLEELISCSDLASVVEDQFGNFVLQKAIHLEDPCEQHPKIKCPDTVARLISAIVNSLRFFQKARIFAKWGETILPEAISLLAAHRKKQAQDLSKALQQAMKEKPKSFPSSQSEGGLGYRKGKPRSEQNYRWKGAEEKKRNQYYKKN